MVNCKTLENTFDLKEICPIIRFRTKICEKKFQQLCKVVFEEKYREISG
jgi:hypothetical protein